MAKANDLEVRRIQPTDKIANLLALLLTREMGAGERIVTLSRAQFSNQEIADLLGTTNGTVNQTLYSERKGLRKKKRPGKA